MGDEIKKEIAGSVAGLTHEDATGFNDILSRLKAVTGTNNDAELAEVLGLKSTAVSTARGRGVIPSAWILNIAHRFKASADWLAFGGQSNNSQNANNYTKNVVKIPLKGTELSAGPGSFIDSTKTIDMISVDAKALQYKGNLSELVFMKVGGDSMEPGIYDGDLVLVNLARKTVFSNRVYAVAFEGAVHVKRLISEPGRLIMRSNNKLYQDITIDTKDAALMSQFDVIGQVTWWMHHEQGDALHIPILSPFAEEPPFSPPRD